MFRAKNIIHVQINILFLGLLNIDEKISQDKVTNNLINI